METSQEVWDKLYEYAKKGAPANLGSQIKTETGFENKLFHLITLAATFHRDKVVDVVKEIDTFKANNPTWKESPVGAKLLNDVSNICLRND